MDYSGPAIFKREPRASLSYEMRFRLEALKGMIKLYLDHSGPADLALEGELYDEAVTANCETSIQLVFKE